MGSNLESGFLDFLIDDDCLTDLHEVLHNGGYIRWLQKISDRHQFVDPWTLYAVARGLSEGTQGAQRILSSLFLVRQTVKLVDLTSLVAEKNVAKLIDSKILYSIDEEIGSNLCVIVVLNKVLFINWPEETRPGRFMCSGAYLSIGSIQCGNLIRDLKPTGRALDLGGGTGVLSLVLNDTCRNTRLIDIDARACRLSILNARINQAAIAIELNDWNIYLNRQEIFDFVVANPPWRVVPETISYPDAFARVGMGRDGLSQVHEVVNLNERLLAPGGTAVIRLDLLRKSNGSCDFLDWIVERYRNCFVFDYISLGRVSVEEQAAISADTCRHLNGYRDDVLQKFKKKYQDLGINYLEPAICIFKRR